jgi:hypothetical protein
LFCFYRHIFENRKYVEEYRMDDIERELGMDRDDLIRLALLLGSDYTEGVAGIGVVNAVEVHTHLLPCMPTNQQLAPATLKPKRILKP